MSKPSASGRRRNTVFIEGTGWVYIPDGKYHRHNLGGGNVLKAVTRTRRTGGGGSLGGNAAAATRAQQRAMRQLLAVANEIEIQEEEAA